MVASESRRRGWKPGDLLRIGVDGTTLFETDDVRDTVTALGWLKEDDVVQVVATTDMFVRVLTRLGVGWVKGENLSDIFIDEP